MCDLNACRICLNTDVRGYEFSQHSLRNYYEHLTRKKVTSKDILPQWVCYECAVLLHKCYKFKQKCLRGEIILKQLTVRGNELINTLDTNAGTNRSESDNNNWKSNVIFPNYSITLESIESVDRLKEQLISPIQYTVKNVRVKTYNMTNFKCKESKFKVENAKKVNSKHADKQRIDLHDITLNKKRDLGEINDEKLEIVDLVKHESVEEILIQAIPPPTDDPIKAELSGGFIERDKHLSKIFGMNNSDKCNTHSDRDKIISDRDNTNNDSDDRENTNNNMENTNNYIENSNYDSDIDFEVSHSDHIDTSSDDDKILSEAIKKRSKAKRKPRTKSDSKVKKTETEGENEVQLKNTRPRKHFLNPLFWKKITLSEEEAVREFKQREFNNDYYLRAKYKCQNCFKGFSKNEMLVRHLKHWHDESCGQMECRFCHMRFRRKHQLVTHIQEHLIVHHCLRCNLQFSRLKTALFHQEHHNGIKRNCKHCGKEFNHLSTYYTHVRMAHRSSHVCVACGASFVSEHGLLQHTKFKHFDHLKQLEEEIRKRREASSKAETSNDQPTAPTTEVPTAPTQAQDTEEIYCVKCDIKFMSRRAYNLHFFKSDNHDDGDAYAAVNKDGVTGGPGSNIRAKIPTTCEHCDKDFPSRQAYKKHHLAEHSHIPLYIPDERDICEICGASIQLGSISYHMKSHTGERDFACPAPACGMRFTLKANMKRHYNVKHLGMPYPKYIRRTPGRRKKKTQEILDNDFSPFVRTRTGYFL